MRALVVGASLALAAACSQPDGPPLDVSGLTIYAPLPGSSSGVAYLRLDNNTNEPIAIRRVESPEFETVAFHESLLEDGVYRMRAVDNPIVQPGEPLVLREGGRHLMLMHPKGDLAIGSPVTLLLHYDADGEIVLRATLQSRVSLDVE